ncbi:MAG: cupin domain-containing protein [Ardenticatenaceae bacterium]|mgnify:CR=1 FL=1|nr:cupin domain-containing protein [Ardenticatenaceae bacterium]
MTNEDTTVKKIDSRHSPRGEMGQIYLASGVSIAMRLWQREATDQDKTVHTRSYETVGYVLNGRARLHIGEQTVTLNEGDSWVVPKGVAHRYEILQSFTAVEATHPPAHVAGRDQQQSA